MIHVYLRKYYYASWSNQISWDIVSYYLYLPLIFIYNDIGMKDFSVIQNLFDTYKFSGTFYQAFMHDNGNWVMNYTCGFAYLYTPFFFIAHLWAKLGGYPADGFSFPYQFCISNGVMLYVILGVFVLRKVLLKFFSDKVTFLTMFFMILATNYFHETINDSLQPHAMLFTCYALVLWFTVSWHEKQDLKSAVGLACVMAFSILARPSEILMLLIPLLWQIYDKESLKRKIELLQKKISHILIMLACGLLIALPQMIYWKLNTDHFVFFSYKNTEGFDFLKPHIFKVLFNFKKSWFVYTPFILFPIISVFALRKNYLPAYYAVLIFFLANFYLLSSWAAWWNGGSFGMRYFVQSYAVMALPFGFMMKNLLEKKALKYLLTIIFLLCIFLNLFQTWQYVSWIIPADRMTRAYYKAIFLKTKVTEQDRWLMEVERSYGDTESFVNPSEYRKKLIGCFDFDSLNSAFTDAKFLDTSYYQSKPHALRMNKDILYSPALEIPLNSITGKDHVWIRVTLSFYPPEDLKHNPASLVIHMRHDNRLDYKYRAFALAKVPHELNRWNRAIFEYMTPFPYRESDILKVYIWMRGEKNLYFDDIIIEAFEKK